MTNLKRLRTERGMRREELAARASCSLSHVVALESDEPPTPGLGVARRIAAALGCEVDEVFPPSPLTPEPTAQTSAERS